MDYGYLERQQKFYDQLQKNGFMDLIKKYAMPNYNSSNLNTIRGMAGDATSTLGDKYIANDVGGNFSSPEFSNATKNTFDISNNLTNADRNLSNTYADWSANDTNDLNQVNNTIKNEAMYNALTSSQASRLGNLKTTDMTRASTDKINANKLNFMKSQIDEKTNKLKTQSESDSWINVISALASILGYVYGGPVGGTAAGTAVKAGGTAIARNNGR